MHQAIDIIRDKADQDYLDAIKSHCSNQATENLDNQGIQAKQLIYLDRNNTPDVWSDISKAIKSSSKAKEYKTFLIVPSQHQDFEPELYSTQNPICPQMIYECIKRIFSRKSHDCLSSENKPKVVEVLLKFARLYDGVDFSKDEQLLKHFDEFVSLDFLQFGQRPNLLPETVKVILDAFNATPPNF